MSLAALRLSTAQCESAFASGPERLPPRLEGVTISEYAGIETVARMGAFIAEHGALGAGLLDQCDDDMDQAETALQDCYHGQFASLADFMEDLTAESGMAIPEALRYYIDWKAMARDAEMNGEFFTVETAHDEVHVFSSQ